MDYTIAARHYDAANEAKGVRDADFYTELARQSDGPVLELACGTGRILLRIARAGIDIVGVDRSPEMLAQLERKLSREPSKVRGRVEIVRDDIRRVNLDRRFPLITMPYRPLNELLTREDQLATLRAARKHLAPEGRLALDLYPPRIDVLMDHMGEEGYEMEWDDPSDDGVVVRRSFLKTSVDTSKQRLQGEVIWRFFKDGRKVGEERALHESVYYTHGQLEQLFAAAGLSIAEEYGTFDRRPLEGGTDMVFVLAQV